MKKLFRGVILGLALALMLQSVCLAWKATGWFYCKVSPSAIPENTEYIDLLVPIAENEELFVPFNTENGEKFGITENSEIAKYKEKGYVSYTFHFKNAECDLLPYYLDYSSEEAVKTYLKKPYIATDQTIRLDYDIKGNENYEVVEAYTPLRKELKTAKMAYLDKAGNIISVSSETRLTSIRENWRGYADVQLKLEGNSLSTDFSFGPPFGLFFIFYLSAAAVLIGILIMFIIKWVKKKKSD